MAGYDGDDDLPDFDDDDDAEAGAVERMIAQAMISTTGPTEVTLAFTVEIVGVLTQVYYACVPAGVCVVWYVHQSICLYAYALQLRNSFHLHGKSV